MSEAVEGCALKPKGLTCSVPGVASAAASDTKIHRNKEHRCKCGKIFNRGKNLYAHMRNVHGEEPLQFQCSSCKKKYISEDALMCHTSRYQTSDHTNTNVRVRSRTVLLCPAVGCEHQSSYHHGLVKHLSKEHHLLMEIEGHMFQSVSDFHKWKADMEKATSSTYEQCSRTKVTQDGARMKYYSCNRFLVSRQTEDKCRLKDLVSCERACPSRVEASVKIIDETENVTVKFWKSHYGHTDVKCELDNEMTYHILPMTKSEASIESVIAKHNYVSEQLGGALTLNDDALGALEKQYDVIINILSSVGSSTQM